MSDKYKKICKYLKLCRTLANFSFSSYCLLAIPIGVMSSAVGIKICVITAGFKKYNFIIKKKHYEIVLSGKDKLNTIEVLISEALINSYISHNEFASVSNVLREYY